MTPRATSEQLVAAAVARIGGRRARVADVGTGSGAIAIAIAMASPLAEVWATDISRGAVALARANARRCGVESRVLVRHGDLLGDTTGAFDVIVANLPYLAATTRVDHPDLEVEPFDAVFAAGDGLGPYRRLVAAAETRLARDGLLLVQLDGRIAAANRDDVPALGASLRPAAARPGAARSTTRKRRRSRPRWRRRRCGPRSSPAESAVRS